MGGVALARILDRPNLICIDMGGTSFDVSLVVDGKPDVASETTFEGFPLLMSVVNIHTIGAGGGSLAYSEAGGLRVGPQSAGADPGPASYGRGGDRPTVTDANLVLGRVDPAAFAGGRMTLDRDAAERAIGTLAAELGLGVGGAGGRASATSSTPRWRRRSAPSPSRRGSSRATSPWSPSAAPGRCTPSSWRGSWGSAR